MSSAQAPTETELDLRSPAQAEKAPGLLNAPLPAAAKFATLLALVFGSLGALVALIVMLPRDAKPAGPTVRTYHIAVEEVQWRYAPSGFDNCTGHAVAASDHAKIFTVPDPAAGLIGDTYWRRRYVGYEPDGTFSVPRAAGWWPHAGIQGPTLRAGVGEVLRVRLLNRGRFPASLHVHGVPLITASRGEVAAAPAAPATAGTAAAPDLLDAVLSFFTGAAPKGATVLSAPNDPFSSGGRRSVCEGDGCRALDASSLLVEPDSVMEFSWAIPAEAGPEGAAGSVGRLYSELTYDGHVDAGLAGVLVVTPAGANALAPPADAPGGEVLALFSVSMESAAVLAAQRAGLCVARAGCQGDLALCGGTGGGRCAPSCLLALLPVRAGARHHQTCRAPRGAAKFGGRGVPQRRPQRRPPPPPPPPRRRRGFL